MSDVRIEKDSMGEVRVPADRQWGAQTQRAVENFPISGLRFPRGFIRALGLIKSSAAHTNAALGDLDQGRAQAIQAVADEVAAGRHDAEFPIDIFQTGSGTSSNMNANEVVARLASARGGEAVHPNDHVNMAQSSNDVIPTAIGVAATLAAREDLLPALAHLEQTIRSRAAELDHVVKTGRTHLMDAMPVRMSQELGAWAAQIASGRERILATLERTQRLPLGGTAVGTGINAPADFGAKAIARIAELAGSPFVPLASKFEGIGAQDAAVELSGQLRTVAVSLTKIANDLRWMNSGPNAGLAEIALPDLQPGSSIMPGKVNPVIPEALAMVCAQVIGNDVTVAFGGQAGNFQLNVMLPVIAYNLLQSVQILANGARLLADKAIAGFTVNEARIADQVGRNPILVTALNPVIGYEKGAKIAKAAYAENRTVKDVALEHTDLSSEEIDRLLDPRGMTEGGVQER
ncbi:MAG: class II fumarate hydratase [Planctomycetota bacterium]